MWPPLQMTDVPTSVGPLQYVCAPDSKHLFLATPARLLLERYLQHTGHQLFPLGTRGHAHPVLSVDCFLNLGPEVRSTHTHTHANTRMNARTRIPSGRWTASSTWDRSHSTSP